MNVERLERLVTLMVEQGVTNLELQDGERRISLSRGSISSAAPAPVAAPIATPAASPAPSPSPAAPAADDDAGLAAVTSPMVGTFYTSPKPGAPAFVDVGSSVSESTDVCIVEAMKVFNTIKAEVSGKIEKILVKDGDAVEFGQKLFLVRPA
jgi:acetyl-CoA carboxylase biotin carboxyl carrier protein